MDSHGITLVELTLVAVIISILATVGLVYQSKAMERAAAADALHYLGMLRSAELRYRANNPAGNYTNALVELDMDLPSLTNRWSAPSLSAPNTTGRAILTRSRGTHQGQTLGITYGTATLCGNFAPLQLAQATCTAD